MPARRCARRDACRGCRRSPGARPGSLVGLGREAGARLATQVQQGFPDRTERIRALPVGAEAPARAHTGGPTWYDRAVEQHLFAEEPDRVLAALTAEPRDGPAQLDGVAELFGSLGRTRTQGRQSPEP
ncbi:hypothetical protein [Kitasatospora griseola]